MPPSIMYLPCRRASGQRERMWQMVGCELPHSFQVASTLKFHLLRLRGVGRVSVPAFKGKDSCPAQGDHPKSFSTYDFHSQVPPLLHL